MILCSAIILLLSIAAIVESECPPLIPVRECTCKTLTDASQQEFSTLTCRNLHSEEDVKTAVEATKGYPMFEFELIDCSFRYIPHDTFLGSSYEVLSIKDSSIYSLSDTDIAFEGLEDQLHLIEIINSTYASNWNWNQLSNIVHIMEVHVSDSELFDITEGLSNIQHIDVETFVFTRNHIESLHDGAFAPFSNLERISIDSNQISELKRSMFPKPAKSLKILGLSHNNLEDLPDDLFVDMPALTSLYLSGNPLHTVGEELYKPVWNQLKIVLIYGANLSCDCGIKWLASADNSKKYIHAICQSPTQLEGRSLDTIHPNEIRWCKI